MNAGVTTTLPTASLLKQYVGRRASSLQRGYRADESAAVATLARLRRALPSGDQLGADTWDVFEDMPEALLGRGDTPSRTEYAAAAALSLFAIHQQSRRDVDMHQRGQPHSPGRAIGQLARAIKSPGVEKRFRAMTRVPDAVASLPHLRGLVTQLRAERIPLDYEALAGDLLYLQSPDRVHAVRMRWTRDFHRSGHNVESTAIPETGDQQ